jgi:hypothetical protein
MRGFGPTMTPAEAAKRISACGRPITTKTMTNRRCLGIGPCFIRVCGRIFYPVKFIDAWWGSQNPPEGYQRPRDYGAVARARI